jgi:glutamine synthetase
MLKKNTRKILQEVSEKFTSDTSFFVRVGAELEFYFHQKPSKTLLHDILEQGKEFGLYDIKRERGSLQYEIQVEPTYYPVKLADNLIAIKELLTHLSKAHETMVVFASKPHKEQPGSALHIHISLHTKSGSNLLEKDDESENDMMLWLLHGLLDTLPASMKFFAPHKKDYLRFEKGKETPRTISWGGNNRTVALRLPTTTMEDHKRRIEHRVPSSDANPYEVLYAIVCGIRYGLEQKTPTLLEKIYGNANLKQYDLETLPSTLREAKKIKHPALL